MAHTVKIVSEYDQEIPQSQTADNPMAPVLSGHSKIAKIKDLKTNSSLMKVESIAECSLGVFC